MSPSRPLLPAAGLLLLCGPALAGEPIVHTLDAPNTVYCLAFSPDGLRLGAQAGSQMTLWDTRTGQEVRRIAEEPAPGVWSVAFSPDGGTVFAPLQDYSIG